jgi:hypothetical protein
LGALERLGVWVGCDSRIHCRRLRMQFRV